MSRLRHNKTSIKRARKLPLSTKITIGKAKEATPKMSYYDLAAKYGCTYQQARRAHHEFVEGVLTAPKYRTKRAEIKDNLAKAPEDLLLEQYHACTAQLAATPDMPLSERISAMDRLVGVKKELQRMSLQSHMRRADAAVIMVMVRRFKPEWTEDQVIAFYHECREEAAIAQ